MVAALLRELLTGGGGAGIDRTFQAILGMEKLDRAALRAAYDG